MNTTNQIIGNLQDVQGILDEHPEEAVEKIQQIIKGLRVTSKIGKKQVYLKNGLSKCNPTDNCFITCYYPQCFAIHDFEDVADRVKMCTILKNQAILGDVNWD